MVNAKYWITDKGFIIGPFEGNHSEKVSSEIREKILYKSEIEDFDGAEDVIKDEAIFSGWIRVLVESSENGKEITFEGMEEKLKDEIIIDKINVIKNENKYNKENIILR